MLPPGVHSFQSFFINLLLLFCLPCVGTDTLIDKFWLCGWLFERLGNVCGCEAVACFTHYFSFLSHLQCIPLPFFRLSQSPSLQLFWLPLKGVQIGFLVQKTYLFVP